VFDTDVWDFTGVVGLPVQMPRSEQIFNFTAITGPQWRLEELTRWFGFLTTRGLTSLGEVDDGICQAYLANRSHRRD
jgi:hypothetical protein